MLQASPALRTFLNNPVAAAEKKKSIISRLAKDGDFNKYTTNLLNLLVDKGRVSLLEAVADHADQLYFEITDTQVAKVTSAAKLGNEQQFLIAKKLQELTGAKNIKLKPEVDAALLGGFVVQYGKDGSSSIDFSVKGQLEKIAAQIAVEA